MVTWTEIYTVTVSGLDWIVELATRRVVEPSGNSLTVGSPGPTVVTGLAPRLKKRREFRTMICCKLA